MAHLLVPPLGRLAQLADAAMMPLMYLLSGTLRESPQQTHKWNNLKFHPDRLAHFDLSGFVRYPGLSQCSRMRRAGLPLFHMPILGGWKRYVVLTPKRPAQGWHIGWTCEDVTGVSRINLTTAVRVLLGPNPVSFFGITQADGTQLTITELGRGTIGRGGEFAHLPLL